MQAEIEADLGHRDLLVQEFVPEVAAGEEKFVLIECAINEPGLLVDRAPGSADRFARTTLARLA